MSDKTSIEWCDATVNIWQGCAKYAPGCDNCYAERDLARWGFDLWGKLKPRLYCSGWEKKLRSIDRKAQRLGRRLKVFINSESDFFEDHGGAVIDRETCRLYVHPSDRRGADIKAVVTHDPGFRSLEPLAVGTLRRWAFEVFDELKMVDVLLVTKRPENIVPFWVSRVELQTDLDEIDFRGNVWLLTSIATQADADRNIPLLFQARALSPVLGLSLEPLLARVDLHDAFYCQRLGPQDPYKKRMRCGIDWVIVGGESGGGARPCDVEWIRDVVTQCATADAPCFVKQLGSRPELHEVTSAAAKLFPAGVPAGAVCEGTFELHQSNFLAHKKGGDPAEWPADLRVRQFPKVLEGVNRR